jgi:hypothetical protein
VVVPTTTSGKPSKTAMESRPLITS